MPISLWYIDVNKYGIIYYRLQIVVLFIFNSSYTFNFYVLLMQNPDAADYSEMKQFMESTLTQAKTNGEKVHASSSDALQFAWVG